MSKTPLWLRAARTSQGHAGLTWLDRSMGETGYRIERWDVETDETAVFKAPASARDYVDTAVQRDRAYVYRVCAYNNNGRSTWIYTSLR
jgi:hypothetical protein